MLSKVVRPVRRVVHALVDCDSTQQLAAGVTLGMILGLVPKGNLIALSLCVLIFSLRVNNGIALISAVVFSYVGPLVDPFADRLGLYVLQAPPLQTTYASLYNLPLGPWWHFNNTTVIGSLLIGLYVAYPMYWMSGIVCQRFWPHTRTWLAGFGLAARPSNRESSTGRRAA